jgi:prepilin-type N-terminal cleavage/methylation domain-containing protein/prepilin-type processing-associated H-X9-DG protein
MIERTNLRPAQRRLAFTLVELLVVIVIIGILVSLLLPAVQSARESARKAQCGNNLHQLGIALAGFESVHKQFPAGSYWMSGNPPPPPAQLGSTYDGNRGSILIHILPYLEQRPIYEQFDFKRCTDWQMIPGTSRLIGSQIIPSYICPSDNNNQLDSAGMAVANYRASTGPSQQIDTSACPCGENDTWNNQFHDIPGLVAPYDNPNNFAGPFTRRGNYKNFPDGTKAVEVRDGLSNTIFFGEGRYDCSGYNSVDLYNHQGEGWAMSNNLQGLSATLYPINYDSCHNDPNLSGCQRPCNWNTAFGFKSRHPSGAQFLFGDGSVHFLEQSIEQLTYQRLGAKADGEMVSIPE